MAQCCLDRAESIERSLDQRVEVRRAGQIALNIEHLLQVDTGLAQSGLRLVRLNDVVDGHLRAVIGQLLDDAQANSATSA